MGNNVEKVWSKKGFKYFVFFVILLDLGGLILVMQSASPGSL